MVTTFGTTFKTFKYRDREPARTDSSIWEIGSIPLNPEKVVRKYKMNSYIDKNKPY